MLAAVIEGPGAVVVPDTAPPRAAGLALVRVTRAAWKRDLALASGAAAVVAPDDAAAAVAEATGGRGADVAIECAGSAVFPLGEVAQALAASERPERLKIVLDVAGP